MHAHMYVCVHFVYSMSDMLHIHTYIRTTQFMRCQRIYKFDTILVFKVHSVEI